MTQARAAVGVVAALLVVGAVVHFQPASKLSADSFASAALDINTLDACKAQNPSVYGADYATVKTDVIPAATMFAGTGISPITTLYTEKDGPCVCKKSICTNGRVCDSTGDVGQCYLPRCPPAANNVPVQFSAGCFCADDEAFTSSNKAAAFVSYPLPTAACADITQTTATAVDCKCGDTTDGKANYCYVGQKCNSAAGATGSCDGVATHIAQKYAYAVPSISKNFYNNPEKFAICKSTAATTTKCVLPTVPATQEGQEAAPKCEVQP